MKKRILLLLLALLCLAGIGLSRRVYAAEVIAGEDYNGFYNVSWQLTDDGVLTISSPRTIHGDRDNKAPWKQYSTQIKKIVVKSPTQWIGENVFSGLDHAEELVLPSSLQAIWIDAFAGCSKLKAVEIPDSVEQIERNAFARCTSLERIKLPNNPKYTEVKEYTFDGCPLIELDIPDPIISIGEGAFSNCTQLKGLRIGEGLSYGMGIKFNTASQLEWAEIYCNTTIKLTGKAKLRRVVLGPKADNTAFTDCVALDSVTLQEGLTGLRGGAFSGCTALENIQLPTTLLRIGKEAFKECRALKQLQLPDGLTYIGDQAFYGCPITDIQLPHGLLEIGSAAFVETKLREVTVPASVRELGEDALSTITLEKILFLGDAPEVQDCAMTYAAPTAYYPAGNSTWTLEKRLALGVSAIWESFCPNTESRVHDFSGWDCVTAPTEEGSGLETRCCALCGTVEERIIRRLESQEPPVTAPSEPTAPTLPVPTEPNPSEPVQQPQSSEPQNGLWYLLAAVAAGLAAVVCFLLRKKRVVSCLLLAMLVATAAPCAAAAQPQNIQWEYDAATGTATATGEGILTRQGFEDKYAGQPLRHLVIGEGIVEIGVAAFIQCRKLESVTFPESLRVVGESAFEQCSQLQQLEFPEGLQILGNRAFYACENVSSITFGSQLRSIGWSCFGSVGKVTQLQLPDSLLYIGYNAFSNMERLQQVSLGAELYYLGAEAFADCGNLQNIRVSRENRHFADRDGVLLTADEKTLLRYPMGRGGEYSVPASVTRIAPHAFSGSALTAVYIPGTVKTIGASAFMRCKMLARVQIAEGVIEIEDAPFEQCSSLLTLTFPASVRQMNATVVESMQLLQIVFLGEKPEQFAPWFAMYSLVVYHPAGDASWAGLQNEGLAEVRWESLCAGDHTPVILPEKEGNCWEKGMTEGMACSQCGVLIEPQRELQLGDHVFAPWQQIRPATETEEGLEERICDICGEKEERSIEKLSPPPPEPNPNAWLIAVIAAVAVCFVSVEIYLMRKKKTE